MNLLAPGDRALLLDALRPDPGFTLDRAVGTTFSVDLSALVITPLAFAMFDTDHEAPDPLALLAAVRKHAENIALYCDAACIKAPADDHRRLFVLLEPTLLPVTAPRGGSFHPKLWVLRFRSREGEVIHRVLVLSRNLTFDRSWDLAVRLDQASDGAPFGRDVAHVLCDLHSLRASAITADLATTVRSARFEVPSPFDDVSLHGLGLTPEKSDDPVTKRRRSRNALVVSPFLHPKRLSEIAAHAPGRRWLVSRADELEKLGAAGWSGWGTPLTLRAEAGSASESEGRLSDLHAKLVVLDDGRASRWYLGSANATRASVTSNAEVMLELRSTAAAARVARLMNDDGQRGTFRSLLAELPGLPDAPAAETTAEQEEARLDELARHLAKHGARTVVAESGSGYEMDLVLSGPPPTLRSGDRLHARPATLTRQTTVNLGGSPHARFRIPRASAVTHLIVVRIASAMRGVGARELVLATDMTGAPEDRVGQLLLDLIPNAQRFAEFVFLLLAVDEPDRSIQERADSLFASNGRSPGSTEGDSLPLYESLVRASADGAERLAAVARLIEQLAATDAGRSRMPQDFRDMWKAFEPLVPARSRELQR